METESQNIEDYLVSLPELSMNSPMIKQLISSLFTYEDNEIDIINKAYLFVRDEISHSWDIQAYEVTQTAEEVLKKKHGICYAKSNLLASLLRSKNIPIGFLYQRLLLTDNRNGPYCIHALNSVYISSINRWIKLDARGNKENVNAQFSLKKESLAFYPNEALGEKNYEIIFTHPNPQTMNILKESNDALHMYMNDLPTFLTF